MDFSLLFRILSASGICVALFFGGWSSFLFKRDLNRVKDIVYNVIKLKPWLYRGVFIAWLMAKVQVYAITAMFLFLVAIQLLLNLTEENDMLPFFCFGAVAFIVGYMSSQSANKIK